MRSLLRALTCKASPLPAAGENLPASVVPHSARTADADAFQKRRNPPALRATTRFRVNECSEPFSWGGWRADRLLVQTLAVAKEMGDDETSLWRHHGPASTALFEPAGLRALFRRVRATGSLLAPYTAQGRHPSAWPYAGGCAVRGGMTETGRRACAKRERSAFGRRGW